MPREKPSPTILLVEDDVVVRFRLAEYLRACAFTVIEAANATDARAILVAGPDVHILMSDAQLAGDDNGFTLAQWVRRRRPAIEVLLTSSVPHKAHIASEFCARYPDRKTLSDSAGLATRIQSMIAERKRRLRTPPNRASAGGKRRRS
jgi:CheY-like chemotaxis protein